MEHGSFYLDLSFSLIQSLTLPLISALDIESELKEAKKERRL